MRLVLESVRAGARQSAACAIVGITERTLQRWRHCPADRRPRARREPPNRLSESERQQILDTANSPEFRDLSPKQIVPRLADQEKYIASESTFYRVLDAKNLLSHRAASRPPTSRAPRRHVATGPNQVWSWDITYLKAPVRGTFYYLYLIEDIWSRKIMGWAVHDREAHELSAQLIARTCTELDINPAGLVLHSDNGGPMKGSTMLATLQRLGVVPSFSRPSVSNDNPFSEALHRTMKYRPNYPSRAFASLDHANAWVAGFVRWYNTEHFHSAIRFVTPDDRHAGRDVEILARRDAVYQAARAARPNRWARTTRNWSHVDTVTLNPHGREQPATPPIS